MFKCTAPPKAPPKAPPTAPPTAINGEKRRKITRLYKHRYIYHKEKKRPKKSHLKPSKLIMYKYADIMYKYAKNVYTIMQKKTKLFINLHKKQTKFIN